MKQTASPIRVLYDHQVFTWQNFGGISRYYADLFSNLSAVSGVVPTLALRYSDNAHLRDSAAVRDVFEPKSACKFPLKARLMRRYRARYNAAAKNLANSIQLLEKGDYDLAHITYFEPYFFDHLKGKPYVVTVYDLIHEVFPEHYLFDTTVRAKEEVIRRASRVIAISHATKKDLVEVFRVPAEKIDVVHLATAFSPETCPPAKLNIPDKFLLHVGSRGGYKNCYFLLRALCEILRADPSLHVICAGGGRFEDIEKIYLETLGLTDRVHYHEASNPSLVALYQRAIALVCPSLYEGFGLPVTEAFNCGCPVISSRASSLVEVAGNAALYFDAKNILSIQDAVQRVLTDDTLRADLREKGTRRAKEFTPQKCARETAEVYARALGRSSGSSN